MPTFAAASTTTYDQMGGGNSEINDAVASGNMLRCGCPLGRPCTCEMGAARKALADATYACGECVNCRLNTVNKKARKQTRRKRSSVEDASSISNSSQQQQQRRRCIRYSEYMRNQLYESIELSPECTFKMRRPDWNARIAMRSIHEKSAFFNTMRQMRLALLETHAASLAVIEKQKGARKKLNRDLLKAKEVLQHLEELKKTTPASGARRMAVDYSHVDSDMFDSFSKQLIPAETLLPDVRARLEKVNLIITNEEKSIKIIRHYVQGFAAMKLQQSVRDFLRSHRWKLAWQDFKDDVQLAAVVTIQASFRMLRAKQTRWFLEEVRRNHHMEAAAATICRFFRAILQQRQVRVAQLWDEARRQAKQRQRDALFALEYAVSRILCRKALQHWREKQRQATVQQQRHIVGSVVTIQRMYRGFRDRLQWKRIRLLNTLSPPVRVLVDHFLVSGNFWGFILEIDTVYRRFEHDKRVEDEDALTFVSTLLRQRKREEDQMMQEWFAASAMQSPIVHGAHQTQSAYLSASPASSSSLSTDSPAASSTDSSLSQTLLESPMATDLIALSPNKRKSDVFPTDLPPKVIRHAMAQGFALDEIIAVLRGLQAQKKDIQDVHLVVKALAQRTPLMTNPWKSERQARHEACPRYNGPGDEKNSEDDSRRTNRSYAAQKQKPMLDHHIKKAPKNPALRKQPEPFVSENLITSIPGGLNAPIARVLFVAALKSFDPDADGDDGAFTLPEDFTIDPFQSYLQLENPLLKIRREHRALEASKPFLAQFTENRCFTGYDVLYNVRGVDELVSWKIPRPLALSIYDVLEQIHRQMTHLSTRNIRREMFISPAFEHFLHARVSEKANKPKETAIPTPSKKVATDTQHHCSQEMHRPRSPAVINSLKGQIRERLDRDVLMLPIQNARMDAVDVLFKAVFLVCDVAGSYEAFLDSLVSSQLQKDIAGLQQVIRDRVLMAKHVADGYAAALQASGLRSSFVATKLESKVADKVNKLLDPIAEQVGKTGALTKHAIIHGDIRQEGRAIAHSLSPLVRQGKVAINALGAEFGEMKIPFS